MVLPPGKKPRGDSDLRSGELWTSRGRGLVRILATGLWTDSVGQKRVAPGLKFEDPVIRSLKNASSA